MTEPSPTPAPGPRAPSGDPARAAGAGRARRRWLRWIGRILLGFLGLVLVVLTGIVVRRDALLAHQVLSRIGPLIGGTINADSIHLSLSPLELQASGVRIEIPQVKGPITARSLNAALLGGHVRLEGLEIVRAGGSDRGPVLTAKSIEGQVAVGKVIAPPYPVDDVRIEEPVFRARLLEPGWTNIQALLGMAKPNAAKLQPLPPAVVPVPAAGGSTGAAPANAPPALFYLRHAQIERGTLIYDDPLSDAVNPVHLEIRELAVDVRDFQLRGVPYGDPLTDVEINGRIAQPQQAGWLHVRSWAEPWRDKPTLSLMAAITGFDVRTIDPYTSGSGGAALGGNWIHVLLDMRATNARIQTGVVTVTVAETGTEMKAPFTGDLFRPTIDKNSALVSAFQLPLGHLLKLGNVSLDVAGQLAIAGLESVLRLGQGAADAGGAVASGATGSGQTTQQGADGDDLLSSLGRGISAFGAGVANAAKRLFQGGEQGANAVGGYGQPARPMAEILAEFEPRHKETMRLFLRERIAAAEKLDPARVPPLRAQLEALGPSPVVPGGTPSAQPATDGAPADPPGSEEYAE